MENSALKEIIKRILLSAFVIISIGAELIYRKPLFDKSLEFQRKFTKMEGPFGSFLRFMSNVGGPFGLVIIILTSYFLLPISKSFIILLLVILSIYIDSTMKILYGDPRPFWVDLTLYKDECDGGYGNPSGHSFCASAVFLSICHIICDIDQIKKKTLIKFILFPIFIIIVLMIMLSRVYLGVHSLDQILYGCCLGLALYLLVFHILYLHKKKGFEFLNNYIHVRSSAFIWRITYCIIGIIILIMSHFIVNRGDNDDYKEYKNNYYENCRSKKYREFNYEGLTGGVLISGILGSYFGLLFLRKQTRMDYIDKEEEINYYFYNTSCYNKIKMSLINIVGFVPVFLYALIPDKSPLPVIYIFKIFLPFTLSFFCLFGVCIWMNIKFKLANPVIYENSFFTENEFPLFINNKNEKFDNVYLANKE